MQLFVFGINHRCAPLAMREKLALPSATLALALNDLQKNNLASEAAIISTCNRTELYCVSAQEQSVLLWLANRHTMPLQTLSQHLYQKNGVDVAQHAFRVASGLDSMVLGETQIFGQIKESIRIAKREGSLGSLLHGLFQRTFATAKEVRSKTCVGAHSVSMAAAAVKLAEKIFPTIKDLNILCIGAGEMISLVAIYLAAQQPNISVANRTLQRAQALTGRIGNKARAITLADIPAHLHEYDLIVSSTASTLPIIGKGLVERTMRLRNKPLLMLDLAVPRDVEAEVAELNNVFLYTIDDMAKIVDVGREARTQASQLAEIIISERCNEFSNWLQKRERVPNIRALRDEAERTRCHALKKALKQLASGVPADQALEYLSKQITNKLIHPPTQALAKSKPADSELVSAITQIYRLNQSENS